VYDQHFSACMYTSSFNHSLSSIDNIECEPAFYGDSPYSG
jgi:hypothetical protein